MDRWSSRLLLLAIGLCIVVIYVYPLALPTPLLDPDEGIHATIAQEMVERGDYFIPRYLGAPFRDKPFLYSAAQALSLRAFGMNEAAVRLPGFLFALLGCATTALLAWRMFDRESALYAVLAALTLALPIILTQSPAHDIALVPFITLYMLSYWELENANDPRQRSAWFVVMSVCVALALVSKGLIGLAVVAPGIAAYAILTRSLSKALVTRCVLALLVGGLLASPWYIAMERASPGYLYYYFIERHLLGFVTEGQEHGKMPLYYYVAPVIGGAMPWLVFALTPVLQYRLDDLRVRNRATLLLACWFVGGFLFLSTANSKLLTYALPLFPPIAVLAGVGFRRFFHNELAPILQKIFLNWFRIASAFGVFAPVITLQVMHRFLHAPSPPAAYFVALMASAAMATGFVLMERGQRRPALAIGMIWFPLAFITLMQWPAQQLAAQHTQKPLAAIIEAHHDHTVKKLILVGQRVGSVVFYLSPAERNTLKHGQMGEMYCTQLDQLLPPGEGTVVAMRDEELRESGLVNSVQKFNPIMAGPFHVVVPESVAAGVASRAQRKYQ